MWENFTGKTLFSPCNDPVRDCSVHLLLIQPKNAFKLYCVPTFVGSVAILLQEGKMQYEAAMKLYLKKDLNSILCK